jgi:hypothetical protein
MLLDEIDARERIDAPVSHDLMEITTGLKSCGMSGRDTLNSAAAL